jgi:hypothetical protein
MFKPVYLLTQPELDIQQQVAEEMMCRKTWLMAFWRAPVVGVVG